MAASNTIILSVDGNIGAGKSTLLEAVRAALPDVEVVLEPVGEWVALKNEAGKSLLELFYEDKRRWSYSFQTCALLTRLRTIRTALASTTKRVILTERSVLTDRHVFAEMLRSSGDMDALEWKMYCDWFDTFAGDLPLRGVIYLTTGVGTSAGRIVKRARAGEEHIPLDYLGSLDAQHQRWVESTPLPVLRLSTEEGVGQRENIARIREFVASLTGSPPSSCESGPVAFEVPSVFAKVQAVNAFKTVSGI